MARILQKKGRNAGLGTNQSKGNEVRDANVVKGGMP